MIPGLIRWCCRWSSTALAAAGRELNAVSPLATMQRGYAVLRCSEDGNVITQVAQLNPGDSIEARLADGTLDLNVERVKPAE